MAFVVTEPCIKCKYTDCIATCPVDCFHEGPNFVVINPEVCIDCNACVPECPTNAIYSDLDIPEKYQHYVALNAELSMVWPVIDSMKDPLPDADEWLAVEEKIQYLEH